MPNQSLEDCITLDKIAHIFKSKKYGTGYISLQDIQHLQNAEYLLKWLIETNRLRSHPSKKDAYFGDIEPIFVLEYYREELTSAQEKYKDTVHPQQVRFLQWAVNRTTLTAHVLITHELQQAENFVINSSYEAVDGTLKQLTKEGFLNENYEKTTLIGYMITPTGLNYLKEYYKNIQEQAEAAELASVKQLEAEKEAKVKDQKEAKNKKFDGRFDKVIRIGLLLAAIVGAYFTYLKVVNNDNKEHNNSPKPNSEKIKRPDFLAK